MPDLKSPMYTVYPKTIAHPDYTGPFFKTNVILPCDRTLRTIRAILSVRNRILWLFIVSLATTIANNRKCLLFGELCRYYTNSLLYKQFLFLSERKEFFDALFSLIHFIDCSHKLISLLEPC